MGAKGNPATEVRDRSQSTHAPRLVAVPARDQDSRPANPPFEIVPVVPPRVATSTAPSMFNGSSPSGPPTLGISGSPLVQESTRVLRDLLRLYEATRQPVNVSFRDLVGPIPLNELTHSLYPYPARLLRQIPRFFFRCQQVIQPGTVVLDPFCGSGTVLVEAHAAGVPSYGIDSNPFARLLTRVKTTPLDRETTIAVGTQVLRRAKALRSGDVPDVVNIDLWYSRRVKRALGRLRRSIIESNESKEVNRILLLCLAHAADRCSLRDPAIPVPVRDRDWQQIRTAQQPATVWRRFEAMLHRTATMTSTLTAPKTAIVCGSNACSAVASHRDTTLRLRQPTIVVTSPPYGSAQKYIRSSSLVLGWTGLATTKDLRKLKRLSIGREDLRKHEIEDLDVEDPCAQRAVHAIAPHDPVRAAIYAHYFRNMHSAFGELSTLLASHGTIILIAGSNTVAGRVLPTHKVLQSIASQHGFQPRLILKDTIRGRVLLTKRASSAPPQKRETIYILSRDAK